MTASFAYGKAGRPYRYYVGKPGSKGQAGVHRISAPQLEALVQERMAALFGESSGDHLEGRLERVEAKSHSVHLVVDGRGLLEGHAYPGSALPELQPRLDKRDNLMIEAEGKLRLVIGARPVFRGGRTWLIDRDGGPINHIRRIDQNLVRGLKRAHRCLADHNASPSAPLATLHKAVSPEDFYHRKLAALAFLAPDIQQAIFEGRQPAGLTLQTLLKVDLPLDWKRQREQLGITPL